MLLPDDLRSVRRGDGAGLKCGPTALFTDEPAQEFRRARNESSMRRFRRADVAPRSKKPDRAVVFGDHLEDVQWPGDARNSSIGSITTN